MTSHGTIALKRIWGMLDKCAPGHTRAPKLHNWCIQYSDRTFPSLPLGPHGKRGNPDIQIGVVKQMVRHLGISWECFNKYI